MSTRGLTGRHIVVTRPAAQAERLMQALAARGAQPVFFPVIDIAPAEDTVAIAALATRLAEFDYAFFVSANAVEQALSILPRAVWPEELQVITVGPGSARALQAAGFATVLVPEASFDSEGVLALPALQEDVVRGRRVLVLRGNGGRELFAETMQARGAQVEVVSCYRRVLADSDPQALRALHDADGIDALSFTSSEGVRNFAQLLGGAARSVLQRPCFAPHARIVEELVRQGAAAVRLTAAGDDALIAALEEYFR